MKKSVYQMIQEAIVENDINLDSPYKLEASLLIDKVCNKINWTEYDQMGRERKLRVITKSVIPMFPNLKKSLVESK